ncbi:hypothetical protein DL771_001238 [Monosporascus sp. 5C6A]|nr:hypothetical protein DL771_001238 [Monosporascus sp. 5C6A]
MRPPASTLFALLFGAGAAPRALAHWNYNQLIVDGAIAGSPWEYIRRPNNSDHPLTDVGSANMRCNSGASSGITLNTSTLTVTAGSEVGFGIDETFGHPGPQQAYLSRAPAGVKARDYDGSGGWARVYAAGTLANSSWAEPEGLSWAVRRKHSFLFTLPPETSPGEYLLRAEGLALHAAHKLGEAQFYVSCAQLRVTGNGTGTLGPLVNFPGAYTPTTPGVLIPDFWTYIKNYTSPGPALWPPGMKETHVVKTFPPLEEEQDDD